LTPSTAAMIALVVKNESNVIKTGIRSVVQTMEQGNSKLHTAFAMMISGGVSLLSFLAYRARRRAMPPNLCVKRRPSDFMN